LYPILAPYGSPLVEQDIELEQKKFKLLALNSHHFSFFGNYKWAQLARVFVPDKLFQPIAI
jgi:hypothetical protein